MQMFSLSNVFKQTSSFLLKEYKTVVNTMDRYIYQYMRNMPMASSKIMIRSVPFTQNIISRKLQQVKKQYGVDFCLSTMINHKNVPLI